MTKKVLLNCEYIIIRLTHLNLEFRVNDEIFELDFGGGFIIFKIENKKNSKKYF